MTGRFGSADAMMAEQRGKSRGLLAAAPGWLAACWRSRHYGLRDRVPDDSGGTIRSGTHEVRPGGKGMPNDVPALDRYQRSFVSAVRAAEAAGSARGMGRRAGGNPGTAPHAYSAGSWVLAGCGLNLSVANTQIGGNGAWRA